MSEDTSENIKEENTYIKFADFLEGYPPNQSVFISDLCVEERGHYGLEYECLYLPEIQLHCDNDLCNGIRFFRCLAKPKIELSAKSYNFFTLHIFVLTVRNLRNHIP